MKPSRRRPMVKYFEQSYRVSERHACCVLELARATYRYEGHQEQWIELRMRIREIAQTRVRYGYRMIRVLLNREGWKVGKDLVYRLYKERGAGAAQATRWKKTGRGASTGALPSHRTEPGLGHGFCCRSALRWKALPLADHRGYLHQRKSCHRSWAEPERRRCGARVEPTEGAAWCSEAAVL